MRCALCHSLDWVHSVTKNKCFEMLCSEGFTYRDERAQSHGVRENLDLTWVLSFFNWLYSSYLGDFLLFPSFASALPPMVPMSSSTQAFIMLAILESFPFLPSNPHSAYLLRPKKSSFLPMNISLSMLLSWFLSAPSMYVKKGFQGLRWWSSG